MFTNDRPLRISCGNSRLSKNWQPQDLYISELYDKLRVPARGSETHAAYMAMKKSQQDELKDVGGFVGGALQGKVRRNGALLSRDIVTLDIDHIAAGNTDGILQRLDALGCGFCVYSTRKHAPEAPRLRVLMPSNRTMTPEEFEAASRKLAQMIDSSMEIFDSTTFEAVRLMYWPSCSVDSQYVYYGCDKPLFDVDGLLAKYQNWQDTTTWPQCPSEANTHRALGSKQELPENKKGVVGAFCRTYSIEEAMETFLPGTYAPCDAFPDRYTFLNGSTTGGAVLYEGGKFLYSHHSTDPAGGQLVNAFDLVRLHKFGAQDDEAKQGTPANRLPSYTAMCSLAVEDVAVKSLMDTERYAQATASFGVVAMPQGETETAGDWMKSLTRNGNTGAINKTTPNILVVLENDPLIKGRIRLDEFANRGTTEGPLPWNPAQGLRVWSDTDDAGLRYYLEKVYGISGKEKIMDGILLCAKAHAYNPVASYLNGLPLWDGVPRLETLFIDYLGVADTSYARAITKKAFTAAVARALEPGVKFDNMTIITGAQGIGKSTLLKKMGMAWFSDSLTTFTGKEARELVQGVWIVEIGELTALSKAENEQAKQFLSQSEDIYRAAYGRRTEPYPRRCVFFGTSNKGEFLRDKTGNRRFWPLDAGAQALTKSVFRDLEGERDQLWAEAKLAWQMGEPLYLSGALEQAAKQHQEEHREQSAKEGLILDFLEKPVPQDWGRWSLDQRRVFWGGGFKDANNNPLVPRERVCALEIWCELFGGSMKDLRYADSQEINGVLGALHEWERPKAAMRCGYCGVQRGFIKANVTL